VAATRNGSVIDDRLLSERYRLVRFIARGGMADVYEAEDLVLERAVAVKLLRTASDDGENARFIDEMLASSRLNHSGVVRLYDAGAHDGTLYLVMELIAGHSLRSVIAQGPVQPDDVVRIGRTVASALEHAHRRGIVHRDVKPGNILIDREGAIQLADFGIASVPDHSRSAVTGATLGTAGYLAPEQVAGGAIGPAADVYSLGLVLLEALTGRKEFAGSPVEAALARLHRDPVVPAGLGAGWQDLLPAMTAREPADRITAAAVVERLSTGARDLWAFDQPPGGTHDDTAPTPTADDDATLAPDDDATLAPEGSADELPAATRAERPMARTWAAAALLGLLVVAAGLSGQLREGPQSDTSGTPAMEQVSSGGGTLPTEAEDALRRLEEAVQP
jgi:eukaryotic-like serine/threonine-protein kinase